MDKPSIIKAFEEVYRESTKVPIIITLDLTKIVFKDTNGISLIWLPGAKETLKLLSDRKDTILNIIGVPEGFPISILNKEKIFYELNNNKCDILISYYAGFRPSDYPAIKDFIIRQPEKQILEV